MKLAFIGLGVMGYPMAGHLKKGGHQVTVFNRTRSRAQAWVDQYQGALADTPQQAAADAEIVFVCVGNDDDLRSVVLDDETGAIGGMTEGSILVDHTTASAKVARELGEICKSRGLGFMDAPVSGGQQGAENGQLTIMCGADPETFQTAEPVLQLYARQQLLMGPVGSGQLTKMVNQITICGLIQSLAEGLQFARNAGLDQQKVIDVISKGAAQSWQMDNRHKTMIAGEYDHGFAVDWMRKDLAICLEEARRNGSSLPVAALVDQFYQDIQNMGGGRWDTSSLLKRLTTD